MTEIHPDDLILVAVMTDPRDLEIARVLGWYRIPVASAPKTLRVDWIAFYLTSAFGDEKWSIRYLARVRGHELVRRRELLRDEPDHLRTDEPYFKIQLGPLVQLPMPIPSRRWRRLTFLYTTGGRLLGAHEIKDLRVSSSQTRDLLLRERGTKP
ncbi:MAG: hypothetical protein AMJ88_09530 [Anaerolineae bacterium SM23_ 63]|nr:MAG: hypothetical protein AMJ88_09530 [Anaerolineae bacterium SM23_ 63]HEY47465.1 hypothetical protein [Anaerolineae bacterium]